MRIVCVSKLITWHAFMSTVHKTPGSFLLPTSVNSAAFFKVQFANNQGTQYKDTSHGDQNDF